MSPYIFLKANVPTIFIGASKSNKIGCFAIISFAFVIINVISTSVNFTSVPGVLL